LRLRKGKGGHEEKLKEWKGVRKHPDEEIERRAVLSHTDTDKEYMPADQLWRSAMRFCRRTGIRGDLFLCSKRPHRTMASPGGVERGEVRRRKWSLLAWWLSMSVKR